MEEPHRLRAHQGEVTVVSGVGHATRRPHDVVVARREDDVVFAVLRGLDSGLHLGVPPFVFDIALDMAVRVLRDALGVEGPMWTHTRSADHPFLRDREAELDALGAGARAGPPLPRDPVALAELLQARVHWVLDRATQANEGADKVFAVEGVIGVVAGARCVLATTGVPHVVRVRAPVPGGSMRRAEGTVDVLRAARSLYDDYAAEGVVDPDWTPSMIQVLQSVAIPNHQRTEWPLSPGERIVVLGRATLELGDAGWLERVVTAPTAEGVVDACAAAGHLALEADPYSSRAGAWAACVVERRG